MDDLTAFVTARLDEDDAALRDDDADQPGELRFTEMDDRTRRYTRRFADNDRVLREVAAKRRLIEEVTSRSTRDVAEIYVATLAAVWSDHPDYRPEWKL